MATKLATIIADFTTSLATAMAVGATTASIQSATDDDGVALPDGTYFFAIDGDNSQKEHIVATLSGQALTAISSVSRQAVQSSGVVRSHRVGSTVTLTDFAHIKYLNDLLLGVTDLNHTTPLKYDGTASVTDPAHIATKAYVDSVAIAGGTDASTTNKGITKMSVAPVSPTSPISVGDNDPRVPTQSENDAMVGTSGTASSTNKYVTNDDTSATGSGSKAVRGNGSGKIDSSWIDTTVLALPQARQTYTAGENVTAGNALCALPFPAADVTLDADATGTGTGSTVTSSSFVVAANSNKILILIAETTSTNYTISGVTYGGASMTSLASAGDGSSGRRAYIFYLLNPTAGSATFAISTSNASATVNYYAYSYYNAAQTAPEKFALTQFTSANSLDFFPTTNGAVALGLALGNLTSPVVPANNQLTQAPSKVGSTGTQYPPTTQTVSASYPGSGGYFMGWLSIAPVTAGGTTRVYKTRSLLQITTDAFIGFAQSTVSAAASLFVGVAGIDTNQSGLTPGALLYLQDTAGTLGTSAGTRTRNAAVAISATSLLITNIW